VSLHHVSASQVDLFVRCPRLWFYERVLDQRRPPSAAMTVGKDIHARLEHWERTGELPAADDPHLELVTQAAEIIHRHPGLLIEQEFTIATYDGGPGWTGFIDLYDPEAVPERILDHKTISDLRYMKTPEEIRDNLQMLSYAKWAMETRGIGVVAVGHIYYRTRGKPKVIAGPVEVVDKEHVLEKWAGYMTTVREMDAIHTAAGRDVMAISPNTASCGMYGGCFFRQDCGLFPSLFQIQSKKDKETCMENLSQLLARKNGAAEVCANCAGAKMVTVEGVKDICPTCHGSGKPTATVGSVPPDAPPRTDQPNDPPAEEPKKRGRKPKAVVAAPTPAAADTTEPVAAAVPTGRKVPKVPPTIYVDCYPIKGESRPVPFEDWLAPIQEAVAEANNVADYGLVSYTSKALLATAIQMSLDTLPECIFVKSSYRASEIFLEVVAPHARKITQRV